MKRFLFLLLLSLVLTNANAQFTCGVSEQHISEVLEIEPEIEFVEGMQINTYILFDGSILTYIFDDGIAVMSVFDPVDYNADLRIRKICTTNFVTIRENRWHSKEGMTLCKRVFKNNKWVYLCRLMEF